MSITIADEDLACSSPMRRYVKLTLPECDIKKSTKG